MMNMKILEVVTPPSIYHGCSTRKTFWEGNFTVGEFSVVNIKKYGRCNVRKHIYIKGSDKYVTLDILLSFGSLDKIRIAILEPKDNFGRSEKGLITSLVSRRKQGQRSKIKERCAIRNISKKDLSNIIREFEKLPFKSYDRMRPKHEPTDSYFYLAIHLENCMVRADALNSHVYPLRTGITATK